MLLRNGAKIIEINLLSRVAATKYDNCIEIREIFQMLRVWNRRRYHRGRKATEEGKSDLPPGRWIIIHPAAAGNRSTSRRIGTTFARRYDVRHFNREAKLPNEETHRPANVTRYQQATEKSVDDLRSHRIARPRDLTSLSCDPRRLPFYVHLSFSLLQVESYLRSKIQPERRRRRQW